MAKVGGNVQNLKVPTSEQARINGRKGGLESAKKKRERKTWKEIVNIMLDTEASAVLGKDKSKLLEKFGISNEEATVRSAIMLKLIDTTLKGDMKALEQLAKITGSFEPEKMNITADISTTAKEIESYINAEL